MKTINKRKNFFVSVILLFALVFSSCSSSINLIGSYAFTYCKEVTSFTVNEDNQNFKSVEGNLYSKDGTKLI